MSEHEPIPRVPRLLDATPIPKLPPPQTYTMAEFLDLLRGMYQSQQQTNVLLERIANKIDQLEVFPDGALKTTNVE